MDLLFLYGGQPFVWDKEKASINLDKHGIVFEKACQVFFDPFVRLHDASDQGEARIAAIGLAEDWSMLFVVHLWSESDFIRIISARLASAQERKSYEDSN